MTISAHVSSAIRQRVVTPHDTNDLAEFGHLPRAIECLAAGDIATLAAGDSVAVTRSVQAGYVIQVQIKRVLATGTTIPDGGIIALY